MLSQYVHLCWIYSSRIWLRDIISGYDSWTDRVVEYVDIVGSYGRLMCFMGIIK